jgi:hypothetical protein
MQSRETVNGGEGEEVAQAEPLSWFSYNRRRSRRSGRGRIPGIRCERAVCRRSPIRVSPTVNAQLVFDNWPAPLSIGFRSVAAGPRRLPLGRVHYQIDLLLRSQRDRDKWSLTGQALNTTDGGGKPAKVTIALLTGENPVETEVNEVGEFHLNGKSDLGSKLRIKLLRNEGGFHSSGMS